MSGAMQHMADILSNIGPPTLNNYSRTVTKKQYERFKHQFVWKALGGASYGREFCRQFKIPDIRLMMCKSIDRCETYIAEGEYVK